MKVFAKLCNCRANFENKCLGELLIVPRGGLLIFHIQLIKWMEVSWYG